MKKKILTLMIISMFVCLIAINNGVNVHASEGNITDDESETIDYLIDEGIEATVVLTSSGGGSSSSGIDFSNYINNISTYLTNNYSDYTWYQGSGYSTKMVSNEIPINMQGALFPKADLDQAIDNTGIASTYGGCGPIAMMGVLDYFARYLGYNEIIEDPTNSAQRIKLAEEVLETVTTYEVGAPGDKDTLTFPWDYVSAFNELIEDYGLENHIVADYNGSVLIGNNRDEYMEIIEEYIPKGVPVTMYMGLNTGAGVFAEHYVNIYAYENWFGYHKTTGERIDKSFLKSRINGPANNDGWDMDTYYADSEILNNAMCGLIYYDVNYDNEELVVASDFSTQFINIDTGQGQYFYDERSATITSTNGYTFNTKRLRCSYIENQYLVLSANRENAGQAYLEFNLPNDIKRLNFDMSLWSATEYLIDGGTLSIQLPTVTEDGDIIWVNHIEYDIEDLSVSKQYPKNYNVLFPENISRFRFLVTKDFPTGDRNKGRIVLDNLTFCFDEEDEPHVHNCYFYEIDDRNHYGTCACGYESSGYHAVRSSASGGRYANCIECNKLIDLYSDIVIVMPYNIQGTMRSINGSYINAQGIIILVDEDIEAYLNGTLTFYDDGSNFVIE